MTTTAPVGTKIKGFLGEVGQSVVQPARLRDAVAGRKLSPAGSAILLAVVAILYALVFQPWAVLPFLIFVFLRAAVMSGLLAFVTRAPFAGIFSVVAVIEAVLFVVNLVLIRASMEATWIITAAVFAFYVVAALPRLTKITHPAATFIGVGFVYFLLHVKLA